MKWVKCWLAFAVLAASVYAGDAPSDEIVVAMRYVQPAGTSHAHLFLYRADGKLLRQLTNDNSGQDSDPIFSQNGDRILFTRTLPGNVQQCWSIAPQGGGLQQVHVVPGWYAQTQSSPAFIHIPNRMPIALEPRPAFSDPRTFTTADGKIIGTITPAAENGDPDAPDSWDVSLVATNDKQITKVSKLDGYSAGFLSSRSDAPGGCVLQDGG